MTQVTDRSRLPTAPLPRDRRHGPGPFAVLWQLFQPEAGEIRTLILFSIVVGILSLVIPLGVESLVNTVAFIGLLQPIVVLALVMMACLGLAAAILALEAVIVELVQRRLFVRVVADLSRRLPRTQRSIFDGTYGPELTNRFFEVPILQKVGAKLLLEGLTVGLSASVGLVVLAFYHPLLLAFGVVLVALLAIVIFVIGRGAVKSAIAESDAKYRNADWVEQMMRHPFAFRLGRGRRIAAERADALAEDYLARRRDHYRLLFRQLGSALLLQVVMSTLLLGLGGWLVTIGQLTLGQLVASWLIVSIVLSAVAKLGAQLESVYDILAACKKLGMLLDLPVEREDGHVPEDRPGPAALAVVGVSHPWVTTATGRDAIDIELAPGDALAVFGPGGSGKSTLLELIHGERDPWSGRIDLDGVNMHSLRLEWVRDHVALARPYDVIAGTIAENIALGCDGIGLEKMRDALQAAGLWDFVQSLPQGLETRLTSFGPPLSTTQADLLVLARVLAMQPKVLLLDGLLDRLDGSTLERAIDALRIEHPPWTLILATQRRSIADRFDAVLALGTPSLAPVAIPVPGDGSTTSADRTMRVVSEDSR